MPLNVFSVHDFTDSVSCLCCAQLGIGQMNAFNSYIRWMPESARWLIANGKLEKAQMYLTTCARINRADGFAEALKTEVSLFQAMDLERRGDRCHVLTWNFDLRSRRRWTPSW